MTPIEMVDEVRKAGFELRKGERGWRFERTTRGPAMLPPKLVAAMEASFGAVIAVVEGRYEGQAPHPDCRLCRSLVVLTGPDCGSLCDRATCPFLSGACDEGPAAPGVEDGAVPGVRP